MSKGPTSLCVRQVARALLDADHALDRAINRLQRVSMLAHSDLATLIEDGQAYRARLTSVAWSLLSPEETCALARTLLREAEEAQR